MRQRTYPTVDHQRLGQFLKLVRTKAGVTQRQLAIKLDQPQSYVSKIESGERQLQVLELIAICSVINIEPGAFLESFKQSCQAEPDPEA